MKKKVNNNHLNGGKMKKKKSISLISDFLKNKGLSRRSFIKATAATGAAVTVGGGILPQMKALAEVSGGSGKDQGKWLPATCQGCTSWCSKQIYVIDGRAVKVRGNPHS